MATLTPSSLNTIYVFQPAEDDAQQWLERIDRHGRLFCWTEEDKLDVAKCRLGPDAQAWDAASAAHVNTWGEYKKAFLQRFGPRPEDLYGKLATCRQSSDETVRQYADRYKHLAAQLDQPLDASPMHMYSFLRGLRPRIYQEVYRMRPHSLSQAIEDAIYVDEGLTWEDQEHASRWTPGVETPGVGRDAHLSPQSRSGYGRAQGEPAPLVALMEPDSRAAELVELQRQVAKMERDLLQYLGWDALPLYQEMLPQRVPQGPFQAPPTAQGPTGPSPDHGWAERDNTAAGPRQPWRRCTEAHQEAEWQQDDG